MISLKKYIDAEDRKLADALVSAWRATLLATGKSGGQAIPHLAGTLQESLNSLHGRLSSAVTRDEVASVEAEIEAVLAKWGTDAVESSLENLNQIREMMMAVAASGAAIEERDRRYTDRFKKLTERLQSAAKVHDIETMRRSVIDSASEMKICIEQMATDGERALSQLQEQVAHYRSQLSEYQKRDGTDSLTGLANRQAIEDHIHNRMSWSSKFCTAVLDLNGFKRINDTWGHAAGDHLLRQFGAEIQSLLRSTDRVGRWGGDEFVIVIESPIEEAARSLDRVREWAFGEYEITNGEQTTQVSVTAAIGIAEWDGEESALDLFRRADRLMYIDKKTRSISNRTEGAFRRNSPGKSTNDATPLAARLRDAG